MKPVIIAVLLTCHNRREKTLQCLQALYQQNLPGDTHMHTYLVDDGSTDGTSEAVQHEYPEVVLIQGDGNLFWNGGMRRAFDAAQDLDPDSYLWLNDDTILYPNALTTLLESAGQLQSQGEAHAIVAGSTVDPETHIPTYGGLRQTHGWHPVKFHRIDPDLHQPQRCDTIHGNCVLIPRVVASRVGNFSPAYTHNLGDYDYGLRARQQGCTLWMAPGYIGTCVGNPHLSRMVQANLAQDSWQKLDLPKGLALEDVTLHSLTEWKAFCQKHAGPLWFVYWLFPYRRLLWLSISNRFSWRNVKGASHVS